MDTYCPAPWRSLEITAEGSSPCCFFYPIATTKKFDKISQAQNSVEFQKLREQMLQGEYIKNCEQCYEMEKHGQFSKRQQLLQMYGRVTDVKLNSLFATPDNLCNLKCRGCTSGAAHLWYNDEIKLFGKSYSPQKYMALDTSVDQYVDLEHVELGGGGEPFYSKKTDDLIFQLRQHDVIKNIDLVITTNATSTPKQEVIESLMLAKKLSINVSIDGIGSLNDYFRSGSHFKDVEQNLNFYYSFFDQRNDFYLHVITTVSVYNVNELKQIENFLSQFPKIKWVLKLLEYPTFIAVRNLPKDYKNKLHFLMKNWGAQYSQILDALVTDGEDQFQHFINYHEGLDAIRNEICPNNMLNQFIENYKSVNVKTNSKAFFLEHIDLLNK